MKFAILLASAAIVKDAASHAVSTSATEDEKKDDPDTAVIATSASVSGEDRSVIVATAAKEKNNPDNPRTSISFVASTSTVCCC